MVIDEGATDERVTVAKTNDAPEKNDAPLRRGGRETVVSKTNRSTFLIGGKAIDVEESGVETTGAGRDDAIE